MAKVKDVTPTTPKAQDEPVEPNATPNRQIEDGSTTPGHGFVEHIE